MFDLLLAQNPPTERDSTFFFPVFATLWFYVCLEGESQETKIYNSNTAEEREAHSGALIEQPHCAFFSSFFSIRTDDLSSPFSFDNIPPAATPQSKTLFFFTSFLASEVLRAFFNRPPSANTTVFVILGVM